MYHLWPQLDRQGCQRDRSPSSYKKATRKERRSWQEEQRFIVGDMDERLLSCPIDICVADKVCISIDHLRVAWKAWVTATSEGQRRRTGFLLTPSCSHSWGATGLS